MKKGVETAESLIACLQNHKRSARINFKIAHTGNTDSVWVNDECHSETNEIMEIFQNVYDIPESMLMYSDIVCYSKSFVRIQV